MCYAQGLGFYLFARRYLGNHFVFFSTPYLDVSVQTVPSTATIPRLNRDFYCEVANCKVGWVSPFGHRRVKASWQLTGAFRTPGASFFGNQNLGIHCLRFVKTNYGLPLFSRGIPLQILKSKLPCNLRCIPHTRPSDARM